jgi:two-component system phosphate regulon sensor histidine kinase PhoR
MRSFRNMMFARYTVAVTLVVLVIAIIIISVFPSRSMDALVLVIGLAVLLGVLAGITAWNQRSLSSDLKEIGRALEEIVIENRLDRMPQPRLAELNDLARDMDTIAGRVQKNYRLLAKERDRLEAILENIRAGIIVLGRRGKIDLINPVAEKILGTSSEFALGRTFTEIHHTPAIDRAIQKSRMGAEVTEEIQITLPRRRTLRVQASPVINKDGGITGVICILEDITARRKLERVRRDFVVNVSHELRTPVANLRAVVEALTAGAWDEQEAAERFLGDLDRESLRLSGIIEDLLVLSRLESEEMVLVEESFRVSDLLKEIIAEKTDLAERNRVGLVFKDSDGEFSLPGDNAIKYNHPGGQVDITMGSGGGTVTINVSDTGIGIPAKEQAKIFERFYRVDRARSRETGGTGLGLSIVRHAAELHGGTVTVESAEGHGSTFSLALPHSS